MFYMWTECIKCIYCVQCIGTPILCNGFWSHRLYILQWYSVCSDTKQSSFILSREFGHFVKHLSLSSWTKEEAAKVLHMGNQVIASHLGVIGQKAHAVFLSGYNPKRESPPKPGDVQACRHFIQQCFINKTYVIIVRLDIQMEYQTKQSFQHSSTYTFWE